MYRMHARKLLSKQKPTHGSHKLAMVCDHSRPLVSPLLHAGFLLADIACACVGLPCVEVASTGLGLGCLQAWQSGFDHRVAYYATRAAAEKHSRSSLSRTRQSK